MTQPAHKKLALALVEHDAARSPAHEMDSSVSGISAVADLRVGELAKKTGKSVRALHLYEELGLLNPTERSKGNFRLFDAKSVERVRWISSLQDMGFSLPEIRELVGAWSANTSAPSAMREVRERYIQKLTETRAQLARLHELERELTDSINYLDTCNTCQPKTVVAACPKCEVHSCDTRAPHLVSGLSKR